MSEFKERYLRNGFRITFEERDTGYRAYHLHPAEGKAQRLVSVTSVLGVLDKPAVVRWAEEQGIKGAVEAVRRGLVARELDPDDAVRSVRLHGLGADAARDKAASRGLGIHGILENYSLNGTVPNPADFPPEQAGYIQGLSRALLELDPEPTAVEQLVCHGGYEYAGRYDLRAVIDGLDTLVDLKTSRGGRAYESAHLQLQAYSVAAQWCGEHEPERLIVVAVGEDGSFEVSDGLAFERHWLDVIACYRAMGEIRKPLEKARRAALKEAA